MCVCVCVFFLGWQTKTKILLLFLLWTLAQLSVVFWRFFFLFNIFVCRKNNERQMTIFGKKEKNIRDPTEEGESGEHPPTSTFFYLRWKKNKNKIGFCSLFCLSVLTQMKKKWQNVFFVFVCTNILSVAVLSLFREKGKIIYKGVPIRSCLDLVQKGRNTTSNHDDDDVSTGQPKKNHSKFFWDFQRNILNDVLVLWLFFLQWYGAASRSCATVTTERNGIGHFFSAVCYANKKIYFFKEEKKNTNLPSRAHSTDT